MKKIIDTALIVLQTIALIFFAPLVLLYVLLFDNNFLQEWWDED